jgi:hypothetical protein
MEDLRYCPILKSVVTIFSSKIVTQPMGKCGKRGTMFSYGCSCEEKCRYTYECLYSSEGKSYDPQLTIVLY